MSILYTVFTPQAPLSESRWTYYQHDDGSVTRTITGPKFGELKPDKMIVGPAFPNAMAWADCLHGGKPHFKDCPEAQEIYTTLHNVAMYVERGVPFGARVCLEGIIENCEEWSRRLKEKEAVA